MAGYADYRRLIMQGWSNEEAARILQGKKPIDRRLEADPSFQNKPFLRPQKNRKLIYERHPDMEPRGLSPGSNYDPGIEELQNSPYRTPMNPNEYVGLGSRPAPEPAPVAQPAPFVPQPPAVSSAEQKLVQAQATLPGPKVNWQNGPSREFYEANAGWNMPDRGLGARPMSKQFPAATQSVLAQGMPQLDQQRKMVSEGLLADPQNQDAQRVNIMQQANFDLLGQQQAQSMFNPMSFLGKIFGGMF